MLEDRRWTDVGINPAMALTSVVFFDGRRKDGIINGEL